MFSFIFILDFPAEAEEQPNSTCASSSPQNETSNADDNPTSDYLGVVKSVSELKVSPADYSVLFFLWLQYVDGNLCETAEVTAQCTSIRHPKGC